MHLARALRAASTAAAPTPPAALLGLSRPDTITITILAPHAPCALMRTALAAARRLTASRAPTHAPIATTACTHWGIGLGLACHGGGSLSRRHSSSVPPRPTYRTHTSHDGAPRVCCPLALAPRRAAAASTAAAARLLRLLRCAARLALRVATRHTTRAQPVSRFGTGLVWFGLEQDPGTPDKSPPSPRP